MKCARCQCDNAKEIYKEDNIAYILCVYCLEWIHKNIKREKDEQVK